ncbi:hypothetical protein DM01DRAFT_1374238 [Hesseltinella vesiculosa]|uniref:Uncharacterized protein n=1 Tax=Hesseltinella vesiculosa TaxID=101127 RepID=A0A1X2GHU9_9FUNG|nr:hypothetical protein DM01DRAFT_1374238 [Hesseltinella vesiculosa]
MPGKGLPKEIIQANGCLMAGNKKSSDRRNSLKQQSHAQPVHQQQNKKHTQGRHKDTHFQSRRHVGLNGFNGAEITAFLSQRYSDTMAAFHNANLEPSSRPVKYESREKAWGNKGSAWGQKGGVMANGQDFLTELLDRTK